LLGVWWGLRGGEVRAFGGVSFVCPRGKIGGTQTPEQTSKEVGEKMQKPGRGRTVALPAIVIEELRQHRRQQAEHLLALGIRLTDDHPRPDARRWSAIAAANADPRLPNFN